jgi:hypothetical protein
VDLVFQSFIVQENNMFLFKKVWRGWTVVVFGLIVNLSIFDLCAQETKKTEPASAGEIPANTWVKVKKGNTGKWLSSIWYMPATDEFISWGKYGSTAPDGVYDVLTFKVGDKVWRDSLPHSKTEAWAGRNWPNWNVYGFWSGMKSWKGPHVKGVYDYSVSGFAGKSRVSFTTTEGILRPTRSPTFHQGCWDSKRNRMVYFVGGQTFSYDPVKREWTDLKPAVSPAWSQHLVWASLCYDEHNDEIMLFGGGMALNAWGGARTWIYDCAENTWRRPEFGSSEMRKLRGRLEGVAELLRDTRCRLQYEVGQQPAVRKTAVTAALAEMKKHGTELGGLAKAFEAQKEGVAAKQIADVAQKLVKFAGESPGDNAHKLTTELQELEDDLDRGYRLARAEPPMRCNTQLVYDKKNKLIVLFGGDSQRAKLCDTWVYDVKTRTWRERYPKLSPPANDVLTATYIDKHGVILAAGFYVRRERHSYLHAAWMYDAAKNTWTPVKGEYNAGYCKWHSLAYSPKDDIVVLSCVHERNRGTRWTYLYRLNPASARVEREGAVNSERPRYYHDFNAKMSRLPAPDPQALEQRLAKMPANKWVEMPGPNAPPKTWSSATIDTDKSVVLYTGGGHSGWSGTDVAHYDMRTGRWSISYEPEFPPFLRGCNRTAFGWGYNLHPWAEHTRRWYAYDPVSKMMVYARQGGTGAKAGRNLTLHLGTGKTGVVKTTGYASWIYDPRLRKWYPPTFDRPFGTSDSARLISTPKGVYAHSRTEGVWHCRVEKVEEGGTTRYVARWEQITKKGPGTGGEFCGTVYDSKRHRLIVLASKKLMTVLDLNTKKISQIKPANGWSVDYREAAYIPDQDVIVACEGLKKRGYAVYRCAENKWYRTDIEPLKVGGKPINRGRGFGADTILLYDTIHKVLFTYDYRSPVFIMRYDDKTVKVRE